MNEFCAWSAVVALLGLNCALLTTQIQILLKVKELLEKRVDEELKHLLTKTELIVEAPKKEKKKQELPQEPRM